MLITPSASARVMDNTFMINTGVRRVADVEKYSRIMKVGTRNEERMVSSSRRLSEGSIAAT